MTGTLFDGWAGPIKFATGVEYRIQSLNETSSVPSAPLDPTGLRGPNPTAANPNGSFGIVNADGTTSITTLNYTKNVVAPAHGANSVYEGNIEVNVPLLANMPGVQMLSVDGAYRYTDAEDDLQGGSTFRWLRGNAPIVGETAKTYTLVGADRGTLVSFEVTPAALTGTSPGEARRSPAVGPVDGAPNAPPTASDVLILGIAQVGQVLTPTGIKLITTALETEPTCINGIFTALVVHYKPSQVFSTATLPPAWRKLLDENDPGTFTAAGPAPILIVQGDADQIVSPATSATLAGQLCALSPPQHLQRWLYAGLDDHRLRAPAQTGDQCKRPGPRGFESGVRFGRLQRPRGIAASGQGAGPWYG